MNENITEGQNYSDSNAIHYNVTNVTNAFRCLQNMKELEEKPNFGKLTYESPKEIPNTRYSISEYSDKIDSSSYTDMAIKTLAYNIGYFANNFGDTFAEDIMASLNQYLPEEFFGPSSEAFNSANDTATTYQGEILTAPKGYIEYDRADGKHVKETWCDLPVEGLIENIRKYEGIYLEDWIREDGVRMYGPYVMVASDVKSRVNPWTGKLYYEGGTCEYGDIVETSLGPGIIMDWGEDAVNCRKKYGEDYLRYESYTAWHEQPYQSMVYGDGYVPNNYANNPLLDPTMEISKKPESFESATNPSTPVAETPKPTTKPSKPVTETPKPTIEPSKPVTETPKPTTEPSKPVTETPKPTTEPSKPVTETPKPTTEPSKPVTETPKPTIEPSKPVAETPKPTTEPSKPVTETPKPTTEPSKPVTETPKPTTEPSKPVTETPKPSASDHGISNNSNDNSSFINEQVGTHTVNSQNSNNGKIAGGVIAGLIGSIAAFFTAKFAKKHKKTNNDDEYEDGDGDF